MDGAELIVMYHRRNYGGVVVVPDSDLAVAIEVRDDNSGPHTLDEVHQIYSELRTQFPGAEVKAASLTEIANAVTPFQHGLPVLTHEIGDTWIYGVPSDPTKLARYRELLRLRAEWVKQGDITAGDEQDRKFLQKFALAAEHTWGTDTKTWLDFEHYTPAALASMLDNSKYKVVTGSWVEKRKDIDDGVAALKPRLRAQVESRLASLIAVKPDLTAFTVVPADQILDTKHFRIGFDKGTGAVTHLEDKRTGRKFAGPAHPLALLRYQTLSKPDYDRFLAEYITVKTDWAPKDFGKPNIQMYGAESRAWHPASVKIWRSETADVERVVVELGFGLQSQDAVTAWPETSYLIIDLPKFAGPVQFDLSWFDKRSNRLPEALWLTFQPPVAQPARWMMSKVERSVSPLDVIAGGNRHMHALTGPMSYADAAMKLSIESLDAAVVSLGVLSPISYSREQPELANGLHYSLFNNGWGTNYVQWFGENARFRFLLSV